MATSKLTASNGFYGYDSYSNSAANHLYVGGSGYRSRLTFKPLSSIAAVGDRRIRVTKALLYLRRNDGGATRVTAGSSSGGKWGAALTGTGSAVIGSSSGWYAIDITACAEAIAGYAGSWYIHMTGGSPRVRMNGTGSDYVPYIKIAWEYVSATISSDSDEAELGSAVTFTIAPEAEGETHTLTYAIGDQSGTIAERAGDSIAWIPSMELATEFTGDETGTATIRMTAYDAAGSALRTELYYQTLRAPDSIAPAIHDVGLTVNGGLGGYGLTGRTTLTFEPAIDMSACYGASLVRIDAAVADGDTVQTFAWTEAEETDPGIYIGAALTGAALAQAGECAISMTATDSRGRTATASASVTALDYSPPVISAFSVERYEPVYDANEEIVGYVASDLGGHVWVNIEASVRGIAPEGVQLNRLAWTLMGASISRSGVSASGTGDQALSLSGDRTILPAPVYEGETWQYTLTLTDTAGGSAAQYSIVLPAHAAVSVSPDKHGFAVGMIATGTRALPRFEVAENYESRFYGGIFGADGYRMDRVVQYEPVEISNSAFVAYNTSYRPRISRVGPLVFLDGMVRNTAELAASFVQTVATLPEWAWPAIDVHALHQGSGRALWWLRVSSGGAVSIQRYRTEDGYIAAASSSQFPLSLNWIAADAFVVESDGEIIVTYDNGAVTLTDETGGLLSAAHDAAGNVTIDRYGGYAATHDGSGNVAIV